MTRLSIGMQSAVPHVLAALERTHDPANVARPSSVRRGAGLAVSLDLIYGAPGESLDDGANRSTTAIALRAGPRLGVLRSIVEEGTKLAGRSVGARCRAGRRSAADRYELADDVLGAPGCEWYEISNWARDAAHTWRHNLAYWRGTTGGGSGPVRTATSPGCGGGTSGIPADAERLACGGVPGRAGAREP